MKILPTVSTVIKGLREEQAPKLFESLARQIEIPLNTNRLKTCIIGEHLVGIDDAGKFIATQGQKLKNGDFSTVSRFGRIDSGAYSKIISGISEKNHKEFIEKLAEKIGFSMNKNRTKTGMIDGKLLGIEYDTGRFISSKIEPLTNGCFGTVSKTGQIDGVASKVVPLEDLLSFKITKRI